MTETANLVISVDSRDADKAEKNLNDLGYRAERTEGQTRRLTRSTDQLGRVMRGLQAAAGAAVTALAVREVIRAADTYTELQSRIKLVTESAREQERVFGDLLSMSNENRSSLESTVNLYSRLEQALEGTEVQQREVMQVTDAFTKALQISGASTAEAEAATQQFSQAIAGNVVRAEEFNSLIDASPRLIRAMIDELEGVDNVGALRQVLEDGELTRDRVIAALTNQLPNLQREFSNLDRTASQAMTQLKNDFIATFGQTDISDFTSAIDELRSIVTDPHFAESMTTLASGMATLVKWTAEGASEFANLGEQLGIAAARATGNSSELQELEQQLSNIDRALSGGALTTPISLLGDSDEELRQQREELEKQRDFLVATGRQLPEVREKLESLRDLLENPPKGFNAADEVAADIERLEGVLDRGLRSGENARERVNLSASNRLQEMLNQSGGGTVEAPTIDVESHDRLNRQLTQLGDVEKLKANLRTQEEVVRDTFERRREIINEGVNTENLTRQQANELQLRNIQTYQERMTELEEQGADARNRVVQAEMESRKAAVTSILGQLSGLMSSENRKMFELGKAASISQATISGIEATQDAFKWGMKWGGPPLAGTFSAASAIATAGRVSAIESQEFMGGGSGAAGGGGGGGVSGGVQSVPAAPAPVGLNGTQGGGGGGDINVTFNGNVNGLNEQDLADRLGESLRDNIENKDFVLFSSRSRQAREINR